MYARKKTTRDEIELFFILSTGKRTSRSHLSPCGARNSSEENILGDGGIRKTTEISVAEEEEKRQRMRSRHDARNGYDLADWRRFGV